MGPGQEQPMPEISPGISRHPCLKCQSRKVRCDRKHPCTRCLKSGSDCIQPTAFRAPRRPRKTQDVNVLDRVRHLEDSLELMRSLVSPSTIDVSIKQFKAGVEVHVEESDSVKLEEPFGRLIMEDEKSRYVSGRSWVNLANQVGDLRALLEDADHSDEDVSIEPCTQYLVEGMFGPQLKIDYSQTGLGFLWSVYVRNINPILKILHVPSLHAEVEKVIAKTRPECKPADALLASIKFAAVTSLSDEECWSNLGSSRESLIHHFKTEVHTTLNEAHFLSSHNLITLQAFVIFLFCNRRREQPRAFWVQCGVAVQLAQSIGLHRDGSFMRLTAYATEIRRRLYWEIRILNFSCAEDCGFLPTSIYGADTRLPLNVNDDDISPGDSTPPTEREGYTDMTYALIRMEISHRLGGYAPHSRGSFSLALAEEQHPEQSKVMEEFKSVISTRYLQTCDVNIPFQRLTFNVGQMILTKFTLLSQYPMFQSSNRSAVISDEIRESLFEKSCQTLELTHEVMNDPEIKGQAWMLQTYVHWHPVAFLLNELRMRPRYPMATRGWDAIKLGYSSSHGLPISDNLALWRPLRGLLKNAQAAAEKAGLEIDITSLWLSPTSTKTTTESGGSMYQDIPIQQPDFFLDENLVPTDENLLAFDLQTPLSTPDYVANSLDQVGSQDWWYTNSFEVPSDINCMDHHFG